MFEWPYVIRFLEKVNELFPPVKKVWIVEDPDELGFWLEEIDDENN